MKQRTRTLKTKISPANKMEEARKRAAGRSAYVTTYATVTEELEDKCASMMDKARNGSKAKAIRAYCYTCMGGYYPSLVKDCSTQYCPLWRFRMGGGNIEPEDGTVPDSHILHSIHEKLYGRTKWSQTRRSQAIRINCHMCTCSTGYALIEDCGATDCTLWRYRLGRGNEDPTSLIDLRSDLAELDEEDDFDYDGLDSL